MNRIFGISRNFIEVQGDLYEVLKEMSVEHTGPPDDMWKEYLGADKIFRKDGRLFFVKQIEEATIVND